MKTVIRIPMWVYLFGGLLAAFGLALGIIGYLQADLVIPGFTSDTNSHKMAIWMTSARNIAMAVVMTYALISKNPPLIALAFLMRFVTEFFDMFGTAFSGVMNLPASAIYLVYIIGFLIPEAMAIRKMASFTKTQNR